MQYFTAHVRHLTREIISVCPPPAPLERTCGGGLPDVHSSLAHLPAHTNLGETCSCGTAILILQGGKKTKKKHTQKTRQTSQPWSETIKKRKKKWWWWWPKHVPLVGRDRTQTNTHTDTITHVHEHKTILFCPYIVVWIRLLLKTYSSDGERKWRTLQHIEAQQQCAQNYFSDCTRTLA